MSALSATLACAKKRGVVQYPGMMLMQGENSCVFVFVSREKGREGVWWSVSIERIHVTPLLCNSLGVHNSVVIELVKEDVEETATAFMEKLKKSSAPPPAAKQKSAAAEDNKVRPTDKLRGGREKGFLCSSFMHLTSFLSAQIVERECIQWRDWSPMTCYSTKPVASNAVCANAL